MDSELQEEWMTANSNYPELRYLTAEICISRLRGYANSHDLQVLAMIEDRPSPGCRDTPRARARYHPAAPMAHVLPETFGPRALATIMSPRGPRRRARRWRSARGRPARGTWW